MYVKKGEWKDFMGMDFKLIRDENDYTEKKIRSLLDSNQSEPIFLVQEDKTYHVKMDTSTKQLQYIRCGELSRIADIRECVDLLNIFESVVIKKDNGKIIGYLDHQKFCEKLITANNELKAYLSTIVATVDESCTVIDSDKRVVVWSKGAEKLFSVKSEEIIGKPITDFFSPDRLEILNTLKEETSVYHSQHIARENQVVLINSNPVHYNDQVIGAVVSEQDITSQVKLNKELYTTSERLFNLEKEVNKLMAKEDPFAPIRGNSSVLDKTKNKIIKASSTDANILIHGESGVGKELFAKATHHIREGKQAPFVALNCGAIPAALFESEIFGYEKGAFSGADQKGKKGKVELAKGGTLFLDEIGEMPLDMQVKILRLLQEKRFYPVGGTKEIEVDFHVVAATNRDLKELIKEGKFREDLYYRLNVVSIEIPPLRERPEDIIELTHYFLHEISIKYNRPIHGVSQAVMQTLLQHNWPGNIRELKNVIERLVVFSDNGEIKLEDLPFDTDIIENGNPNPSIYMDNDNRSLNDRLQELEKEIILKELQKVDGNKQNCAKNLQITRATLYNRLNKLGIKV
ncbi:sigma-54 interaction domain-containing protein [Oceanobacillus halotolerans]|uniref:sigma-54 interaction domain-containing protein n=1 Tax=Oceanobacillus halotolerans TaxID=2663380 RepID=UPI001CF7E1A0|nr:sigma 54-interacting transcriptional regulator [Oceanobacillus halotolerans]